MGALTKRRWAEAPAVQLGTTEKVPYLLGDQHGGFSRAVEFLTVHGFIRCHPGLPMLVHRSDGQPQVFWPNGLEWIAPGVVLVCTGDLLNKGKHSLEVVLLFKELKELAREQGGDVVVVMGNHDAEFLAGWGQERPNSFHDQLVKLDIDPRKVAAGHHPVGAFLAHLPLLYILDGVGICHAGNTQGMTRDQLERWVREVVKSEGFGGLVQAENSLLTAKIKSPGWWNQHPRLRGEPVAALDDNRHKLGIDDLVQGHQKGRATLPNGYVRAKRKPLTYQSGTGSLTLADTDNSRLLRLNRGKDGKLAVEAARHTRGSTFQPIAVTQDRFDHG